MNTINTMNKSDNSNKTNMISITDNINIINLAINFNDMSNDNHVNDIYIYIYIYIWLQGDIRNPPVTMVTNRDGES